MLPLQQPVPHSLCPYVMKKKILCHIEPLIHLMVLAYIFLSPVFFTHHGEEISWQRYVKCIIVPTALCLAFYANYLLLVPHRFMQHRYKTYFTYNALIVLVLVISIPLCFHYLTPILHDGMGGMHHHGGPNGGFPPPHGGPRPPHVLPGLHHGGPKPEGFYFFGIFNGVMVIRDFASIVFAIGGAVALRLSIEWRSINVKAQQAQLQLADAALKNLKSQTSPHFLLNTLNNIYSLTAFDTEKAQHAILELSKMLRYQLYESDTPKVLLRKEAEFLKHYIELMKLRIGDNVKITTHVNIMADESIVIAPHVLICLVENAFKHGVSAKEPSFIDISLEGNLERIHFVCTNSNHPQPTSKGDKEGGIGLNQVAQRLQLVYPGYHSWTHGPSADGTTYTSEIIIFNDAL